MGVIMPKKVDISGQRFGRLFVLREDGKKGNQIAWRCLCDCGAEVTVAGYDLRNGHTKSCGCLMRELARSQTNRRIDMTGMSFGRLTVVRPAGKNKRNQMRWFCVCDCGRETIIDQGNLVRSKSCGCVARELASSRLRKHGASQTEKLYGVWLNMRRRCDDPDHKSYSDYGGRGIKVCDEWQDYESFRRFALSNGWEPGLQLNRIDNDGNYEPGNVNFATARQNSNNRRNTIFVDDSGEMVSLSEFARRHKISYSTVWRRYRSGRRGTELLA